MTINFQADQVVSGLATNFVGVGLSMVLGEGLSKAGAVALLPYGRSPACRQIPVLGPIMFTNHSIMVYFGYLLTPAVWYYINRTRPGLHLRAVGEYPSAADALGINVYRPALHVRLHRRACLPGWPAPRSAWRSRPAGSAS